VKAIMKFASQLGARFSLNADLTVNKAGRYFLLNEALLNVARQNFYYAGTYLGKVKNGKFFPSFNLLAMLAESEANKVVVDKKTAWLFICGRDIFRTGILAVRGSRRKGDPVLVLNDFGECLGFGRIVGSLAGAARKGEVAVKNISDVGDFLRREI
jgi:ribosome biogenesis protein Nip4